MSRLAAKKEDEKKEEKKEKEPAEWEDKEEGRKKRVRLDFISASYICVVAILVY